MTDQPDRASAQRVILAALAKWEAADALRRTARGAAFVHWDEECDRSEDVIADELDDLGELGVARLIRDLAGAG